jgi:RNA polymerase sigma factor (sigma-70 family)
MTTGPDGDGRRSSPPESTDADLIAAFVANRDEGAFAAIVQRHGPLVFQTARRVVGTFQDAEDVFQATFLVLAQKAGDIRRPAQLASWLYGVAVKAALKARRASARRTAYEGRVKVMREPSPGPQLSGDDLGLLLDEELDRLPNKYREPVVLCDLQGRTRREVARELGVSDGTLSQRINIARRLLADRLRRRGVVITATALALFLTGQAAAAAPLPPPLVAATAKTAVRAAAGRSVAGLVSEAAARLAVGLVPVRGMALVPFVWTLAVGLAVVGLGVIFLIPFLPAGKEYPSEPDPGARVVAAGQDQLTPPDKPQAFPVDLTAGTTRLNYRALPFEHQNKTSYVLVIKEGRVWLDPPAKLLAECKAYVMLAGGFKLTVRADVYDAAGNHLGTAEEAVPVVRAGDPTIKSTALLRFEFGTGEKFRTAATITFATRVD